MAPRRHEHGRDRGSGGGPGVVGEVQPADAGDDRDGGRHRHHRAHAPSHQAGGRRRGDEHGHHQQVAQALHGDEQCERHEHEQREVDDQRTHADPGRAEAIEADGQQACVQQRERREDEHGQPGGETQIGVRDAEDVAEEQALQARRRGGREGEQDAGAEERGHHHRDGGVAADGWHLAGGGDRDRGHEQSRGAAEQQRDARERGEDEPRQQRMRQRFCAVGEVVEDDPAPQRTARHAQQRDLEQRAPPDRIGPWIGERVQHGEHQW